MSRLSMNEVTTFRWSFDEDVFHYQQAGFQAIGLWRRKLADFGVERGVDLLLESGLGVSNLFCAGGFTGSDGRSLSESIDDALSALHLAGEVNARCLTLFAGGRNNHIVKHAERLLKTALLELLPLAEWLEIPLALKPKHPACAQEWTFLTDLKSTADWIRQFESPWLQIAYDTYHFPVAYNQLDELRRLAPRIAVVHIADARQPHSIDQQCCLLGAGQVPLVPIIAALQEGGYNGDFDVKLAGPEIEHTPYGDLLSSSFDRIQQLVAPAIRGC